MSTEDLLGIAANLIRQTENATEVDISAMAYEYIKSNKELLKTLYIQHKHPTKKVIFMAGSPGAGKSEFAKALAMQEPINIFDTDEIRKLCPTYSGKNSQLFQKASSKGIDILVDEAFANGYSFILDGNFATFSMQKQNIERSLKKGFTFEVKFIFRPLPIALEYTKSRENREGRTVPEAIFYEKFIGAVSTIDQLSKEFDFSIDFIDLEDKTIEKRLASTFCHKMQSELAYASSALAQIREKLLSNFNEQNPTNKTTLKG